MANGFVGVVTNGYVGNLDRLRVGGLGKSQLHGQRPIEIEARLDLLHVDEAAHGQGGAHQWCAAL